MPQINLCDTTIRIIGKEELSLLLSLHQYNEPEKMLFQNAELIENASIGIYGLFFGDNILGELRVKYTTTDASVAFNGIRAYLYALRIREEYRQQGLARHLLSFVIAMLEEQGYKEFTIGVERNNTVAAHLYKSLGFHTFVKKVQESYQGDDYEYSLLLRNEASVSARKHGRDIKLRDLQDLSEYREYLTHNPKLTYLFFELTDACNLSCLHCGSRACPNNRTYLPEMSIRKVLESVAQEYDPSQIMICLTGGEPLLHPSFFSISSYARKLGFSCGITTNATLITKEVASKLIKNGVGSVTVSIDGLETTHDWFRNSKGSFIKAVNGVRNLIQETNGLISTQITTVVNKKNLEELDQLYSLIASLKVDSWRIINMEPIGRALDHSDLLLDSSEIRYLLNYIRSKRFDPSVSVDVTYGCSHYLAPEYEREVRDTYFLCGSGIMVASVLCNGDIYSCLDIERRPELVQGNIAHDDFVDVWKTKFTEFRSDRSANSRKCKDCSNRQFCKGDSAHTWNYDTNEPLLCIKEWLTAEEICKDV